MLKQQQDLYRERREVLMSMMGAGSLGVWMSAPVLYRGPDVAYPYRQQSDLLYLTGCQEPGAILALQGEQGKSVLFLNEPDAVTAYWDGPQLSLQEAKHHYGVDEVLPASAWKEHLTDLAGGCRQLVYQTGNNKEQDDLLLQWMKETKQTSKKGVVTPCDLLSPATWLHKMRMCKSDDEVERMKEACLTTVNALKDIVKAVKAGMSESELEAYVVYQLRRHGCEHPSFFPIVASGSNATILHYREHTGQLCDGDLLLLDIGGECSGYAADVSRTIPVNGVFTQEQRDIYQIVADAQAAAVAACQPGNRLSDVHNAAVQVITEGLVQLGVLEGDINELVEQGAHTPYFPHRIGHWLGLDVHDVGSPLEDDGSSRILKAGMVLTVEPGLYFNKSLHPEQKRTKYEGIGIRIEDDVLITDTGHENLTSDFPTDIDSIEALLAF